MIQKKDVAKYLIIGLVLMGLVGILVVLRGGPTGYAVYTSADEGATTRGPNWNGFDYGGGDYSLKIYNSKINFDDGNNYVPFTYGPYDGGFRDWNGLIYRISTDSEKAYINLYDVDDNYISSFGFGITGEVGGADYKYTTLNFTWTWSQESIGDEYIFRAHNNNANFNWTQEFNFYPNQSMKIKNTILNNLANIDNAKFWYIQLVNDGDGIWFNGTRYTEDAYKTGEFDSLISKVKFEDYYIFDYEDLLENNFNITDFYLGDGSVIGVNGVRILAIGVTKGNSVFLNGASVTLDPSIIIGGGDGGDVYVDKSTPNKNHGDKDQLNVQRVAWQRSYLNGWKSFNPKHWITSRGTCCSD